MDRELSATAVSREATLDGCDVKPEPASSETEEVARKPTKRKPRKPKKAKAD